MILIDDASWVTIEDDPIVVVDTLTQVNASTHQNANKMGVLAGATSPDDDDASWVNIDDDGEPIFVVDTSTQVNTSTHNNASKKK